MSNSTLSEATAAAVRLLLVEDDPSAQDLIRALCEGRGHAIDVAADGFLGLRLLSERRHTVVLIDYHLPEMDGYALARLMREIARPEDGVRLVGVTADSQGLAARRGADALFDAILTKPIDPASLFSTLDRLTRAEPPAPAAPIADAGPADALWRRRGLPGRPRAVLCPEPGPDERAAVGQAFDLVEPDEPADLVLVGTEAGLERLRALRAAGPNRLVPSVDLTGRLGDACDLGFRVDDPDSWSALAKTAGAFAQRRSALAARDAAAPSDRLIALLYVTDRSLRLQSGTDAGAALPYETGHGPAERMAAALGLMQAGLAACEPVAGGVAVRLTEAGLRAATDQRDPAGSVHRMADSPPERSPPAGARPEPLAPGDDPSPMANEGTMAALRALIGTETVARLHGRLIAQLADAFAADASDATIAHEAHILISMAGTLGFDRLSQACRALQDAVATGRDVPRCLSLAREAGSEVTRWRPTV